MIELLALASRELMRANKRFASASFSTWIARFSRHWCPFKAQIHIGSCTPTLIWHLLSGSGSPSPRCLCVCFSFLQRSIQFLQLGLQLAQGLSSSPAHRETRYTSLYILQCKIESSTTSRNQLFVKASASTISIQYLNDTLIVLHTCHTCRPCDNVQYIRRCRSKNS